MRPYVPDFEILIDDLSRVPEQELLRRPMTPLARLVVFVLRAQRVGHDPALLPEWLRELERASETSGREVALKPRSRARRQMKALEVLFVYLSEVEGGAALWSAILEADASDDSVREVAMGLRREWEERARAEGEARGEARVTGLRREWEERARAEGEARGEARGVSRGRQELLLKQLRLRFGELPRDVVQRVRGGTVRDLDRWAERVITAASLDDIWD